MCNHQFSESSILDVDLGIFMSYDILYMYTTNGRKIQSDLAPYGLIVTFVCGDKTIIQWM